MAGSSKSLFDGFLYLLNLIAASSLGASYLAFYFDPQFISLFSFFALGYPLLLVLNLLFVLYWLLRMKTKLVLSVLMIALGYQHLGRLYQWEGVQMAVSDSQSLKVMSYNLRMFNRFDWIAEKDIPARIAQLVEDEAPDILAVQEYHQFAGTPDFPFPHRYMALEQERYGLGIFSKYPIRAQGRLDYGLSPEGKSTGYAAYADIEWRGQMMRVINVHLASVRFGPDEYLRLSNPGGGDQESIKRDFLKIYHNIREGLLRRSHQIARLEEFIAESPHPVVLCGDFNDTPHSYSYGRIAKLLEDSFMEAGHGLASSFQSGPLPLRIDFIFHDSYWQSVDFGVTQAGLSDHEAIYTRLYRP